MEEEKIIMDFITEEINTIPNILKKKLTTNNKKITPREELEKIKHNINKFLEGKTSNRFNVLSGLRGVGKTILLYQTYEYLLKEKNINPEQILYISCEELNNINKCDIKKLIDIYLKQKYNTNLRLLNKKIFLLIDEAQYDKNWSISGKIIYDKTDEIFMIFTGSSALSMEYNADSARRMLKKVITPLNYSEHIKLKYGLKLNITQPLIKLIFEGKIDEAKKAEEKINTILTNHIPYTNNDWEEYLKYGGFPILFNENDYTDLNSKLIDMVNKVINTDLIRFKNFNFENQANANRILRFLALQKAGNLSQNKLSNYLKTSSLNVKNILDTLEKTKLIFHCEPYGTSTKRINKSWKYYFATSSLRYNLSISLGNSTHNTEEYEGTIIENLVASTLFNFLQKENKYISLYYDSNDTNSDFILQEDFKSPIPIEVGRGKKDKRQIKTSMNKYNAEYGIIVSNKESEIKKDGDVIHITPKTFSFL